MGRLDIVGFDDVEKMLLHEADKAVKAVPLMLRAGADVLIKGQKAEAETMGIRRTGDFIASIGIHKEEINGTSSSIIVMAKGKDRKGVRNVEKGFIIHYGLKKGNPAKKRRGRRISNRNMEARPWMDNANEKNSEKVHEAMREIWEGMNNG